MNRTSLSLCLLATAALASLVSSRSAWSAPPSLADFTQPALRDVTTSARVLAKDERALKKIGKGFAEAYTLSHQQVVYREPMQVRFTGKKGLLTIRDITNGTRHLMEIRPIHRRVDDLTKDPGKGHSITDLGVMTPAWVSSVEARWLRSEVRDGKTLQVFEYHPKSRPRARRTIWVDPETRVLVEQVTHQGKQGIKKRTVYSEPRQFNGVWLPTQATIYNGEGQLAGKMRYENVQVNSGVSEALFKF